MVVQLCLVCVFYCCEHSVKSAEFGQVSDMEIEFVPFHSKQYEE